MLSSLLALFSCGALLPAGVIAHSTPVAWTQEEGRVPATEEAIQKRLGLWETETREGQGLMLVERNRLVVRENSKAEAQYYFARHLEDRIEAMEYGKVKTFYVRWDRKTMIFAISDVLELDFQPSTNNPGKIELRPLRCPKAKDVKLGKERVAAVTEQLIERGNLDQSVRRAYQNEASQANRDAMHQVDEDNRNWIIKLLGETGWPDSRRFGDDAAEAAFLIVQHSGQLDLMWTAREALQGEVRGGRFPAGRLALLHDRLQLALGYPQKYGSQIHTYEDGSSFVAPLLNAERVNAYRAEVGLTPLEDYLEFFADEGRLPQFFEWPAPKPRERAPYRR